MLPSSWKTHGLARIILYVNNDVEAKLIEDNARDQDLQHILVEVGKGKDKHVVDMYYREWKSCVSGQNSQRFHIDYFQCLTNI